MGLLGGQAADGSGQDLVEEIEITKTCHLDRLDHVNLKLNLLQKEGKKMKEKSVGVEPLKISGVNCK